MISDRYVFSSIAYQGYGRGLAIDEIQRISEWAMHGLWPDLTFLLEVPAAIAAKRLGTSRDRFEREDDSFHERVLEGFRGPSGADPDRWVVLDGTLPVDAIADLVRKAVSVTGYNFRCERDGFDRIGEPSRR